VSAYAAEAALLALLSSTQSPSSLHRGTFEPPVFCGSDFAQRASIGDTL
jgi:hypothetical protein